jgi:hypothetical protein
VAALLGCGDSEPGQNDNQNLNDPCQQTLANLEVGDPDGHPDPLGARAAGQARASRITDSSWIVQPQARQRIRLNDFLLINDRIAVYIESGGLSDGYAPFGGEILSVDKVGEDGRPMGLSRYGETLTGLSNEMLEPDSITVMADGSEGGDAVIRVAGTYRKIPFLTGAMGALFSEDVGLPAYIDFHLAPGESTLRVRRGLLNNTPLIKDLSLFEFFGFFHYSRAQKFTPASGYADPKGGVEWVAFDGGDFSFLWRQGGARMTFALEISGLAFFMGGGTVFPACSLTEQDYYQIVAGGPELDGLLAAARDEAGDETWRPIQGQLLDASGEPVGRAIVHVTGSDDEYLTRARTGEDGAFTVHAPLGVAVRLQPQQRGYPHHEGQEVGPSDDQILLTFGPSGLLEVSVSEAGTLEAVPSRIQVIPDQAIPGTPASHGVEDERAGRLHQHFDVSGEATLRAPAGGHRVVVSRGYEFDLLDTHVTVDATAPALVSASLVRSVDISGYLCADLHVHTHYSPDSNDPADHKVRGMVADGLHLPLISDHEWVTDAQAFVEELGLDGLVKGISSEEVTTFDYGHFGLVPMVPRPDEPNNGAINWVLLTPQETFDLAHSLPEQPLIIVNHPRAGSVGGFFSAANLLRETLTANELWSDDFDLIEAFNGSDFESNRDSTVADWFAFLGAGWTIPVVGSSDNHHLRTGPTGYPRSCAYFGHDDPTQVSLADLREALASGDMFVSGGLYLNISGPGGERMGETIESGDSTVLLTVTVQAASWVTADTLEIFLDGQTLSVDPLSPDPAHSGPGKRFLHEVSVPVPAAGQRSFVVAYAKGEGDLSPLHPGKRPFGVTNAIYLRRQ